MSITPDDLIETAIRDGWSIGKLRRMLTNFNIPQGPVVRQYRERLGLAADPGREASVVHRLTIRTGPRGYLLDRDEPPHIDALLYWSLGFLHGDRETTRELPLPLLKFRVGGVQVYRASALFAVDETTLQGWFAGRAKEVRKLLRRVPALGEQRGRGLGEIVEVVTEPSSEDRCLRWDGRAMRYLPHRAGGRLVRPRPPYWSEEDRVACLIPGEPIDG